MGRHHPALLVNFLASKPVEAAIFRLDKAREQEGRANRHRVRPALRANRDLPGTVANCGEALRENLKAVSTALAVQARDSRL
jgi:hypothetical protein